MTRFVVTAPLILFVNQASSSISLGCGSQFDPGKLRLASMLYYPDRTVLTHLEAMGLELAAFGCNATELVQVPNLSCDLVHRTDRDNRSIVGNVVANHSPEHASLSVRWATWARWFLAFANAPLGGLANRAACLT